MLPSSATKERRTRRTSSKYYQQDSDEETNTQMVMEQESEAETRGPTEEEIDGALPLERTAVRRDVMMDVNESLTTREQTQRNRGGPDSQGDCQPGGPLVSGQDHTTTTGRGQEKRANREDWKRKERKTDRRLEDSREMRPERGPEPSAMSTVQLRAATWTTVSCKARRAERKAEEAAVARTNGKKVARPSSAQERQPTGEQQPGTEMREDREATEDGSVHDDTEKSVK